MFNFKSFTLFSPFPESSESSLLPEATKATGWYGDPATDGTVYYVPIQLSLQPVASDDDDGATAVFTKSS